MRDDGVYVYAVETDDSGTSLSVRCGDAPVRLGQRLFGIVKGKCLVVTVDRVSNYGHEFTVLHPGLTARMWVSPGDAARTLPKGTILTINPSPESGSAK